jgi:hypothetical protein
VNSSASDQMRNKDDQIAGDLCDEEPAEPEGS